MNTALAQRLTNIELNAQKVALVIARLTLAWLFFTQLWWKAPPMFGCPADFAVTTTDASGKLKRTGGLCDWMGIEAVWSERPHPVLVADLGSVGGPKLAVDIGFIAAANGAFLKNFAIPNIRWFGYVVWGMEFFIFASLFFGVFSRLGGLVSLAQSAQLMIGLAGISNPGEWEWPYNLMVVLSIVAIAYPVGRTLGLDAILQPRLKAAGEKGNKVAAWVAWLA